MLTLRLDAIASCGFERGRAREKIQETQNLLGWNEWWCEGRRKERAPILEELEDLLGIERMGCPAWFVLKLIGRLCRDVPGGGFRV
jgi:hypothetical protein